MQSFPFSSPDILFLSPALIHSLNKIILIYAHYMSRSCNSVMHFTHSCCNAIQSLCYYMNTKQLKHILITLPILPWQNYKHQWLSLFHYIYFKILCYILHSGFWSIKEEDDYVSYPLCLIVKRFFFHNAAFHLLYLLPSSMLLYYRWPSQSTVSPHRSQVIGECDSIVRREIVGSVQLKQWKSS